MAHDVFISYSNKDKAVADAACATLERRKIRCWIAPRDVPAGLPWASALVSAINDSQVMVLILSERSNNSDQVIREVDQAVGKSIPILPLRIDDVDPSDQMRYYIKSIHWLDALSPPLERHLEHLADSVEALMQVGEGEKQRVVPVPTEKAPAKQRALPTWALALIILASVLIIGSGGWLAATQLGSGNQEAAATSVAGITEPTTTPTTQSEPSPPAEWSEWQTLSFSNISEALWQVSGDNHYTAVEQNEVTAFLWSDEIVAGDVIISFNYTFPETPGEGQVIIYGDGFDYTQGSLIFNVLHPHYGIVKHSPFGEENYLAEYSGIPSSSQTHEVRIEIIGDEATLYADGQQFRPQTIPEDIVRQGKIGFAKFWDLPSVTYADIRLKTRAESE